MKDKNIVPKSKKIKSFFARVILYFLGRAFVASAKHDIYVKKEIENWPDSLKILIKIQSFGPCLLMKKEKGTLKYLGSKEEDCEFAVYFKNIETALLVLTGRLGIDMAYAQHRFSMKGDIIAFGMPFVRCLYIVEAHLFPSFIAKKILKRMPKKGTSSFKIYMGTLFGI
ncbi:hypothetical protein SAMN05443428_13616 [Caloramator quimbayensis]|uniref:SCP-2 sterol transfer family protein n=1 Tax=Caloramator quimbayensis TaxID=1147123 RepID=A0A1T4YDZ5_9CLOT|nr:hypothetical protein [Caloramator quimbayensis]SKA99541.1 hypothetical protein SAMN05443428_13616 [Caloramator quimbayensis]